MIGSLLDATAFLTRVPVPTRRRFDLARAAWAFPLVGAAIGAVVAAVAWAAHLVLPALAAAVLAVAAEVVLTGALHLDGLADCADGCGGADRAARLRIMKDHAVGVYGASALVLTLGLQVAVLHGLLAAGLPGAGLVAVLVAGGALSRAAMLLPASLLRYARPDGTGATFVQGLRGRSGRGRVAAGLGLALVLTVGLALAVTPWAAALAVLAGLLTPLALMAWARRGLGGVTGDVLGATAELTRAAVLVVVLAVLSAG